MEKICKGCETVLYSKRQVWCSRKCMWKFIDSRPERRKYKRELWHKVGKINQKIKRRNKLQNFNSSRFLKDTKDIFIKNISSYVDKIIDYPSSPTGKAYIGIAKKPLMKNDNGIGFKGVILQTDDRNFIQCYGCGKWFKLINKWHLKTCLKIGIKEYKDKFGLKRGTTLIPDASKNFLRAQLLQNVKGKRYVSFKTLSISKQNKLIKNLQKGCSMAKSKKGKQVLIFEKMNEYGTCPEQLKYKMIQFIHSYKRLPVWKDFKKIPVYVYKHRFGSLNNAFLNYGLPTIKHMGSLKEFTFQDGTAYFIKDGIGYDGLYNIMLKKCLLLKN